jgi:hypothetical protein
MKKVTGISVDVTGGDYARASHGRCVVAGQEKGVLLGDHQWWGGRGDRKGRHWEIISGEELGRRKRISLGSREKWWLGREREVDVIVVGRDRTPQS